jgi:cytochrome c biogenesis protein CcdA/thiol-disulfide isomerase/thioredoxin
MLVVFLGGVLTILSPCILPVLPFVFARAGQPFVKSTLPLLFGMALTFAGIATLAAVGGAWAVRINQYGRVFALVLLVAFAATLLSRHLADWLAKPFVALGNRLLPATGSSSGSFSSFVLGIATGLLWAPCAGPILGLVLTGAAISGPNTQTTLLLFAYAAGAALSLAIAMFAGGRLLAGLKKNPAVSEWFRRLLGVAVLAAVVAILMGWDTNVLTRLSTTSTTQIEQALLEKIHPESNQENGGSMAMSGGAMAGSMTGAMNGPMTGSMTGSMSGTNAMMSGKAAERLPNEGELPSLDGATAWLNSTPLTPAELRGKVVVIDFWTYSCINCLRALPYVKTWYEKYKDYGLVVIGIHAPEFAFEKDEANVKRAVKDLGVNYPVALDNNYAIWQAFNNQYWPAHYFIDAQGKVRSHHFGEGKYDESEQTIRDLLTEAGVQNLPEPASKNVKANGVQAAADEANVKSPETYLGYERAEHFSSPEGFAADESKTYKLPYNFTLNDWALEGNWLVDKEKAVLIHAPGKLVFRFSARDLHLVLGPNVNGKPVRFRVLLDNVAPAKSHGVDIDAEGNGIIKEQRLYQLIRQQGDVKEHTFTIEFLDEGAQAFSFTFG